jgi:agmatinase
LVSSLSVQPFLASRPGLASSDAVILGIPLDITESFRPGTAKAPDVVRHFSDSIESYSRILDRDLEDLRVADLGDLDLAGLAMPEALALIEDSVAKLIETGTLPVMIGGEHTLTLATSRAVRRKYPDLSILQVDAHHDLITKYSGDPVCHATVFRRISEEMDRRRIAQVGVRSGVREEWEYAKGLLWSSSGLVLPRHIREALSGPVYLSIDIDVLDPSATPGTGCLEPGGPGFSELQDFLHSLEGLDIVAVDIVEVLPEIDPAGISAVTAAKLIRESILLFAGKQR